MRVPSLLSATLLIGTGIAQQTAPDSNVVFQSSAREVLLDVYPEKESREIPGLRAQFLKDGRVLATQNSVLHQPDSSGAVPMAIQVQHPAITK
jgi:hypothetical protein